MFEKCGERLERKRFCEVTKMAGVDAAQQTRMKNIRCCVVGGVQRLVHSKVHSDVHSSVHSAHGVWRFWAFFYEYLRAEKGGKYKRISQYSTC